MFAAKEGENDAFKPLTKLSKRIRQAADKLGHVQGTVKHLSIATKSPESMTRENTSQTHTLLTCPAPPLQARRAAFLRDAFAQQPSLVRLGDRLRPQSFLDVLLSTTGTLAAFSDYVADIFELCETTPMVIISSEEEYHQFTQGTHAT